MDDTFITIASVSEGMYKNKGSKFLAFAYPVSSTDEVKEKVGFLRKKYFDARHHCYAYRLGLHGESYRTHDDGEPVNSAGKPILGQLVANGLTDVLVVVVRYFGGVLLGVGGLVQAYKQATANALAKAQKISGTVSDIFVFRFGYSDMDSVLKVIKDMNLEYYEQKFDLCCSMKVKIRAGLSQQIIQRLSLIESLKIETANQKKV